MKCLLSILLIMLLVLPMAALAEEPFTLRNGYTWDMSKTEAMKLAQEEGLSFSAEPMFQGRNQDESFPALYYDNVVVGKYTAFSFDLVFKQEGDSLSGLDAAIYGFKVSPAEYNSIFEDILLNLTNLYGTSTNETTNEQLPWITWQLPDTFISLSANEPLQTKDDDIVFVFIKYEHKSAATSSPAIKDGGY